MHTLKDIASRMVAPGKGLLAMDESLPTIEKRFKSIEVESTEENRRAYRELLVTTAGLGEFISGAILHDETIRQKTSEGVSMVEALRQQGIYPGIKVDQGRAPLTHFPGEKISEGLDGLSDRLKEYHELGAVFTKYRAVISIGEGLPSQTCLQVQALTLARFAAMSQEAGLVPVVEPEVLMDGSHSIERCEAVTERTLGWVIQALRDHRVALNGLVIKPNMVVSGKNAKQRAASEEVAEATIRCFKNTIPPAVPGVAFLSGGQDEVEATQNLNAINKHQDAPWQLAFSFARALQGPVLKQWGGKMDQVPAAQKALHQRAWCNHHARYGTYTGDMEQSGF